MANQQLVDFVSKMRSNGSTDEQIMAALLNSGWNEVEINMALDPNYVPPANIESVPEKAAIAVPQAPVYTKGNEERSYNIFQYLFLASIGVLAISLFLPFINIFIVSLSALWILNHTSGTQFGMPDFSPLVGAFTANSYGTFFLIFLILIIALFFWKRMVSLALGLVVNLGILGFAIYKLITNPDLLGSTDLFSQQVSLLNFLGIGFYMAAFGVLGSIVFSIISLKRR